MRIQRFAGNAAVSRALTPDPALISALKGSENELGEKIGISPDLLEMLSLSTKSTAAPTNKPNPATGTRSDPEPAPDERFVKGEGDTHAVDPDDVNQGNLGDCYLMAAMMAVAHAHPEKIESLISKRLDDGTYNVTLYIEEGFWNSKAKPKVISVSPNGNAMYAGKGDGPELWAMLIEKAYAKHKGGYSKIVGGYPGDAAAMLTGGTAKKHKVASLDPKEIAMLASTALVRKWPITAYTPDGEGKKGEVIDAGRGLNIYMNHAYAIMAVDVENLSIYLRNPWGKDHPDWIDIDGVFKKYFDTIDIAKP